MWLPLRSAKFITHVAFFALFSMTALAVSESAFATVPDLPERKGPFTQVGLASFYRATGKTASGMKTGASVLTAAHRSLPFGSKVRVRHLKSGREVEVVITDRGPFIKGRVIDISRKAAKALGIVKLGIARVRLISID